MDAENLRDTIEPKSDQLNYDDLITGPVTVKITAVKRGSTEQPVAIEIEGMRPFLPCKSMRRVLITAWGDRGADWVGLRMTLYGDPFVKFGGVAVGGIRISHMDGIDKPLSIKLTTSRSKRSEYVVQPLAGDQRADKCRAFLRAQSISIESAEAEIGKTLDNASAADFKAIAAWAKGQAIRNLSEIKRENEAGELFAEMDIEATP